MTRLTIDKGSTPEEPYEDFYRHAVLHLPTTQAITLHLDARVWKWLKSQGPDHQARINRLLRHCMQTHEDL